jgi:hypothetical protein
MFEVGSARGAHVIDPTDISFRSRSRPKLSNMSLQAPRAFDAGHPPLHDPVVRRIGLLLAVLLVTACSGRMAVRSTVLMPPELPVRVFPEIAVVPGAGPNDRELAQAIAAHLAASTESRVESLDEEQLEARRAHGELGPASAVLRVTSRIIEATRPMLRTRPETACSPWRCTTQPRTVVDDVPVVFGVLVLRVEEGRSQRVLEELTLEEREEGADPLSMRMRVALRLRRRAIALVDSGEQHVEVELAAVGDRDVSAALDAIQQGRAAEGRAALERIVGGASFAQRPDDDRAKVLFNLGQARRLEAHAYARARRVAPAEIEDRLAAAERAIQDALRLRPEAMYARAIRQIADERRARARLRAQEDAASHNFALDRAPDVPEPPPAYRTDDQ